MLDPAVHAQLASVLPAAALLTAAEDTRPYECDGLTMYRELPAAVAIPEDEAQLVEVLRRCHAAGVPVVARGAGTSLSGGALPDKRGVLVAMAKFRAHRIARPGGVHGRRPARRAQPGDIDRCRSARSLLRARPVVADRVHDRRQRRRERRGRALSQIRLDGAQRPPRARCAHHRRDRRIRRRLPRQRRLRPARAHPRVGGAARRHDRNHGQAHAQAPDGASGARRLRRRRCSGRGGRGRHRRRDRAGGARDDGPERHARGRGIRARRLSARRGGGAAGRNRRHARGSGRRHGGDHARAGRRGRHRHPRVEGRTRAPAALVGPQGGVSRGRPDLAGLLLHRRHDSAPRAGACAAADRAPVGAIQAALRQRVPRRRRQPSPAHPVRRERSRGKPARRGLRRRDSRAVHRSGRHDHRRARRRRREAAADVRAVPAGRARPPFSPSRRRSTRNRSSTRARVCPRCRGAPSSARCTCITERCGTPSFRVSDRGTP